MPPDMRTPWLRLRSRLRLCPDSSYGSARRCKRARGRLRPKREIAPNQLVFPINKVSAVSGDYNNNPQYPPEQGYDPNQGQQYPAPAELQSESEIQYPRRNRITIRIRGAIQSAVADQPDWQSRRSGPIMLAFRWNATFQWIDYRRGGRLSLSVGSAFSLRLSCHAKGMSPRAAPADYQAHAQAAVNCGRVYRTLGPHMVREPSTPKIIVVEAGLFGSRAPSFGPLAIFLRINGKKAALPSEPYGLVVRTIKTRREPPVRQSRKPVSRRRK